MGVMGRCYACRLAHGNYSFAMPSVPAAHVAVVAAARGVPSPQRQRHAPPTLRGPMPPALCLQVRTLFLPAQVLCAVAQTLCSMEQALFGPAQTLCRQEQTVFEPAQSLFLSAQVLCVVEQTLCAPAQALCAVEQVLRQPATDHAPPGALPFYFGVQVEWHGCSKIQTLSS